MLGNVASRLKGVKERAKERIGVIQCRAMAGVTEYLAVKKEGDQYIAKAILILSALAVGALFLTLSKTSINSIFTEFDNKIQAFMSSFTW